MDASFELVLGPEKCCQWLVKARVFLLQDDELQ